jgi:ATP-dependent Clp protease adaptor protein ClpS
MTAPGTIERIREGTGSKHDEVWRVIVLNDDHNTFEGVAFALSHVLPGVGYERGLQLANTIHNRGLAVVWSGHREPAEHYWEQLRGYGLTMAPLEGGSG